MFVFASDGVSSEWRMVAFVYRDIKVLVMYVIMSKECKRRIGCHVVVTKTTEAVFIRQVACSMQLMIGSDKTDVGHNYVGVIG